MASGAALDPVQCFPQLRSISQARDALARRCVTDPLLFMRVLWPSQTPYDKQVEIGTSLVWNDETDVPAGNELGKDWIAGRLAVWFFLTRHPVRIVTSSAKDDHLRVLWGEIGNAIATARKDSPFGPIDSKDGGPLLMKHREVRKLVNGKPDPLSYLVGMVASADTIAAMQGHHIANVGDGVPRTLFVGDECSSMPDDYVKMARTWAKRILLIGNTWPCENFWKKAVEGDPSTGDPGGDRPNPRYATAPLAERRYWRKLIHITATDSPNVKHGLELEKQGIVPDDTVLIPGVKSYWGFKKDLETLHPDEAEVKLWARFYKGKELKLFPQQWLDFANDMWRNLKNSRASRKPTSLGVDPGEGVAKTSWAWGDEYGLIGLEAYPTPEPREIVTQTIAIGTRLGISSAQWVLDRGGGGFQIASDLRAMGYPVSTVGFGEGVLLEPKRGIRLLPEKIEHQEQHYAFVNRRAQMYGELSEIMDPNTTPWRDIEMAGYALPPATEGPQYAELLRQLKAIPRMRDSEGRLMIPPKGKKPGAKQEQVTLEDLIGHSPDEADSCVLMCHRVLHAAKRVTAGAIS